MTLASLLPLLAAEAVPFDVVGFGENSVDFVSTVEEWPAPDSKQPLASFDRLPGGQVATAIAVCARLHCRARYVGVFGGDEAGQWLKDALARQSVDVAAIDKPDAATRMASVIVSSTTGARAILERRDPRLRLHTDALPVAALTSGRILLVDATDVAAATHAAAAARTAGCRTVLDVDRVDAGVGDLLRHIDIVITSAEFPQAWSGAATVEEGLRRIAAMPGVTLAVATLGARGSVAVAGREVIRTPAVPIEVVDTTGAGDAFRGGFIAAWLRANGSQPLEVLLRQANIAAGLSCRGRGAQGALPTWSEVEARL